MANNFFKLVETYKKNYGKLIDKDLSRIKQIEKDRSSFLSSLSSWLSSFNKQITNNLYKRAFTDYLSKFKTAANSVASNLDTIHKFYEKNITAIDNSFKTSGLSTEFQNTIKNNLTSLSASLSTLESRVKESYVIKNGDEYKNGEITTKLPLINVSNTNIYINYYDYLVRKTEDGDNNYLLYDGNIDYSELFSLTNDDSGNLKLKILGLPNLGTGDGKLVTDYSDYATYYEPVFFYTLKNASAGDKKTYKTIFNEKSLLKILEFYDFLLLCRKTEIERYKEDYNSLNGNGGILSLIKSQLTILKNSYLRWKNGSEETGTKPISERIQLISEDGKSGSVDDVVELYIRNYLWGSMDDSVSEINGTIKKFESSNTSTKKDSSSKGTNKKTNNGITPAEVNAFLTDKTNKKAKNVQDIFDFVKDFVKQLENYDIDKKFEIDEKGEVADNNLSSGGVSKKQFYELKSKMDSSLKEAENNTFEELLTLKDKSDTYNELGNTDTIYIDADNQTGINIYSIYGGENDGLDNKTLLSWTNLASFNGSATEKNYYNLYGDSEEDNGSESCFPQGLYLNLADDNIIKDGGLLTLANSYLNSDYNIFGIINNDTFYDQTIFELSNYTKDIGIDTNDTVYKTYFKEAATLASIYNNATLSKMQELMNEITTEIDDLESEANELNSGYTDDKNTVEELNNEEVEIIKSE